MAPAGDPAGGFACRPGGVADRLRAGAVHGRRREDLEVFEPAGDLFGQPGEIRRLRETGQGQLRRCGLDRGVQQPQEPLQVLHRSAGEGV